MKQQLVVGFAFLFATPSLAQGMTTLQYILAKGVVIHADLQGRPVDMRVTYNPDGTSAITIVGAGGRGAEVAGKWRIDGDRFCTINTVNPEEACFDIPVGKKPGDTIKVMTPALGEAVITINP